MRRLADVLADIDRTNPVQIIAKVFSNIAVQHPLAEFVLGVDVITEGVSFTFLEGSRKPGSHRRHSFKLMIGTEDQPSGVSLVSSGHIPGSV